MTVAKARAGIERLVHLTPQTARVISGQTEALIPASEVKVGDVLRVLPGETVPVDGVILSGQTSINQAVMTGESLPVDKEAGDEVKSGTVNQFGSFDMKAQRVGEDSSIQRMIRLVQSAGRRKGEDRWNCRPVGHLDRGDRPQRGGADLAFHRRDHPCSHYPGAYSAPVRWCLPRHCDHGSDRQCDEARVPGPRGVTLWNGSLR